MPCRNLPVISYQLLVFVVLCGLLVPLPAQQQVPFVVCSGVTGSVDPALGCTLEDLLAVPVRIYNFLTGAAALVLLAVIAWAGLRMMLFYLAEAPESELAAAKLTLTRGIFGILIVAGSYLIVNLVLSVLGLYYNSAVANILCNFKLLYFCPVD